jgi:hypothetical protein
MMTDEKLTLPTEESPQIVLSIYGNLKLSGWDQNEILVKTNPPEMVQMEEDGDTIRIQSQTSAQVFLPAKAHVQVEDVHGNCQFKSLEGDLSINKIGGNLTLDQVGPINAEKVYGNLSGRTVTGDMTIQTVYGNVTLRNVKGRFFVSEKLKGNLVLKEVSEVNAAAHGNCTLSITPVPDHVYDIEAGGNINCRLSEAADADISITSDAQHIHINLPEISGLWSEKSHQLTLGAGGAKISLTAKGPVHISQTADDPEAQLNGDMEWGESLEGIGEDINQLIDIQMDALQRTLNERLSDLPDTLNSQQVSTDIEEIVEQARQYSNQAAMRAQLKARDAAKRAQEKLTRKLEKARQRAEKKARRVPSQRPGSRRWQPSRTGTPRRGASETVSDEERMMVLKMLEENKITLEEAESLLSALEGEDS